MTVLYSQSLKLHGVVPVKAFLSNSTQNAVTGFVGGCLHKAAHVFYSSKSIFSKLGLRLYHLKG
jgi:hypothetical protein